MVSDFSQIVHEVSGIGDFTTKKEKSRQLYQVNDNTFLVINNHTLELRCDTKLSDLLKTKYESVMESRYFGKNGIEIVPAGQLTEAEIEDLIRLSYDLTVQKSA